MRYINLRLLTYLLTRILQTIITAQMMPIG